MPVPTGPAVPAPGGALFGLVTRRALATHAGTALELRADGQRFHFTAGDLGLRTDVPGWLPGPVAAGPLAELVAPSREELRAQLAARIDQGALERALVEIASGVDRRPVDATLRVGEDPTLDAPGRALDLAASRDVLVAHLLDLSTDPLDLPVVPLAPTRTRAALQPAADAARRALVSRFRLTDGVRDWEVDGKALRSALAIDQAPTALAVRLEPLAGPIQALAADVDARPADARLDLVNGRIVVRPERAGRHLDRPATLRALGDAVVSGSTTVPIRVVADAPSVAAADLTDTAARLQRVLDQGVRVEVNGRAYMAPAAETWDLFAPVRSSDRWELWLDPTAAPSLSAELSAAHARGLVLQAGDVRVEVPPDAFAAMLRVNRSAGAWRLSLDPGAVAEQVDAASAAVAARDAEPRYGREGGRLRLRWADRPLGAVDRETAIRAVLEGWRAGTVPLPTVAPPPPAQTAPRRLDQHDRGQYLSAGQAWTWESSSCSAAALASALNARGVPVRIHDVIAGLGSALSPRSGLLVAEGLPRAAASLGVPAALRKSVTLRDVQAAIAAGDIALVDFTDEAFPDGHWVVVTAVTAQEVRVVDSSAARLTTMSRWHLEATWSHRVVLVGEPSWRSPAA
ncbi:MAG TPA: peptidoglycan binding domain-containing protein [Chloroflexota bacterium]